ncbi:MAG: elongation factor Ts [Bacteroidetes bacterium]|nr:MAG: elongation factor Ts [Bacteroidota bacterium]
MTKISAAEVNNLRKQTGAGLMDCKNALVEANGDFEDAIVILRKQGQKIAAKRADRAASEGVIIAKTTEDGKKGIMIELNCETDFVAKNEDFISFANSIADVSLSENAEDLDAVKALSIDGLSVEERLNEQMGKIGEKIDFSYVESLEGEKVISYIHPGAKLGVLIAYNATSIDDETGKDVAMQIAAMNPIAIDEDGVDQETIDKEKEIFMDQIKKEGKPEEIAEKIAIGKLNKFFKENTLVHQQFVKDNSKTISQVLTEVDKELKVTGFKRKSIGS